jgi:hypothetical protein
MLQLFLGALASLIVNGLTVAGWYYLQDPLMPSVVNVALALGVLGYFGLEDRWAFPAGYWAVELLCVAFWLQGFGIADSLIGQ